MPSGREREFSRWTRAVRWAAGCVIVAMVSLCASDAGAKSFSDHVNDLRSGDPKIRTIAALALGASDIDDAVQPLCTALSDSSDTVRQAVAIALKRLKRTASLPCLKARASSEGSSSVKLQIDRAIESIEAGGKGSAPSAPPPTAMPNNPNARYYLALKINNNTGVSGVDQTFVKAFLDSPGSVQLAPRGEGREAAEATMKSRNLAGYQMSISLERFDGSGGLTLKVRVAYATYPQLNIIAMSSGSVQNPSASPGDSAAERELIANAASNAPQQFRDFLVKNGKSP